MAYMGEKDLKKKKKDICICITDLTLLYTWKCASHSVVSNSCDPMDCSPPGSSIHGIFQAKLLEWVAIFSSIGLSRPRDRTWVSCIAGRLFTVWATREAPYTWNDIVNKLYSNKKFLKGGMATCNLENSYIATV